MDRIWQWAWDRYGARYSWAIWAIGSVLYLPVYVTYSMVIVASENSDRYVEAAAVTAIALLGMLYMTALPGLGWCRLVERWEAGHQVGQMTALEATYRWTRGMKARGVGAVAAWGGLLSVVDGAIAGAPGSRLIQYAIVGFFLATAATLVVAHSFVEAAIRPARVAIAGDTGIGDLLPRSHPTFAAWSNLAVVAAVFGFAVAASMLTSVFDRTVAVPMLAVIIAGALTFALAVPISVAAVRTSPRSRCRRLRRESAGAKRALQIRLHLL